MIKIFKEYWRFYLIGSLIIFLAILVIDLTNEMKSQPRPINKDSIEIEYYKNINQIIKNEYQPPDTVFIHDTIIYMINNSTKVRLK